MLATAVLGRPVTATFVAGPAMKVTEGWSFSTTCAAPGFAVAVKVFVSALVELIVVTKTPLSWFVTPLAGVLNVFPEPDETTETGRSPIG